MNTDAQGVQGLPRYAGLTTDEIGRLHDASLVVLSEVGVRIHDDEALSLLRKAGAHASHENIVRIPSGLVEWALKTAPKTVTIYGRDGLPAMELGGYRCYFGVGSDCMYIYDLHTGHRREAILEDVRLGVRLVDALPNLDFAMSMFMPSDVAIASHEARQMAMMLQETTKPIIYVGEGLASTESAVKMASVVAGGLEQLVRHPFIVNYVNAKSPLSHNQESLQRLLYCAERNLPSIYAPANARGTTAPMTAEGAVITANAGQLTGLVLSQLKREGAPFIRKDPGSNAMDMRTMVMLYASPDGGRFGWDLAHHHGLPIFGTGGCSDAKVFDAQAAAEATLTLFASVLGGANLIHDIGYLDCAMTGSLELVAFCDEIIGWMKRYFRPPILDDENLTLETIKEVGLEDDYLGSKHTLHHLRDSWKPGLFDRFDHRRWAEQGSMTLLERANRKVMEVLAGHVPPRLPQSTVRSLDRILLGDSPSQ